MRGTQEPVKDESIEPEGSFYGKMIKCDYVSNMLCFQTDSDVLTVTSECNYVSNMCGEMWKLMNYM